MFELQVGNSESNNGFFVAFVLLVPAKCLSIQQISHQCRQWSQNHAWTARARGGGVKNGKSRGGGVERKAEEEKKKLREEEGWC